MSHPLRSPWRVNTNYLDNPDHNIWNNNGTWWCHFTVHNPDYTKERVRVSLHTKDRDEARQRRDFIMRGTTAIACTIPRSRGQAMPDIIPEERYLAAAV
jgi:hypothetical protein